MGRERERERDRERERQRERERERERERVGRASLSLACEQAPGLEERSKIYRSARSTGNKVQSEVIRERETCSQAGLSLSNCNPMNCYGNKSRERKK